MSDTLTDDEKNSLNDHDPSEQGVKRRGRPPKVEASDLVSVMVIAAGDGRISKGTHVAGVGDDTYARKDVFQCPPEIAEALQKRGFVEIE